MSQIWSSKNAMNADEVWDDTELIKMYDESIQEFYNQDQSANGVKEKTFTAADGTVFTWKVGEKCMAPYEEDGNTTGFAATIDWIGKDTSDVGVTFIYYGNQTTVKIGDLWHNAEAIAEAVEHENREKKKQQKKSTMSEAEGGAAHEPASHSKAPSTIKNLPIPTIPPPVPPNILAYAPVDDQEAFNSMLMSWYMNGYHTGYYQGRLDRRAQEN